MTEEKAEKLNIFDEEEVEVKPDIEEGIMAERDPKSVMPDPYAVDKAPAVDPVKESLDKQIATMGKDTRELLHKSPKDTIIIPKDKLNPHDDYVDTAINGYIVRVKRGIKVSLPRPIVDLLIQGGYGPTLAR